MLHEAGFQHFIIYIFELLNYRIVSSQYFPYFSLHTLFRGNLFITGMNIHYYLIYIYGICQYMRVNLPWNLEMLGELYSFVFSHVMY